MISLAFLWQSCGKQLWPARLPGARHPTVLAALRASFINASKRLTTSSNNRYGGAKRKAVSSFASSSGAAA